MPWTEQNPAPGTWTEATPNFLRTGILFDASIFDPAIFDAAGYDIATPLGSSEPVLLHGEWIDLT